MGVRLSEQQSAFQADGIMKFREGERGGTDFTKAVGIGTNRAQEMVLLGVEYGIQIIARQHAARVEHFDGIDTGQDVCQLSLTPMTLTKCIKWVGNRDKGSLGMEQIDGLLRGQTRWNFFFEEEGEKLSLLGHNLLTDDEAVGGELGGFESTDDGIVVGDYQFLDTFAVANTQQVREIDQAVFGVACVAVEIDSYHQ